MRKILFIFSLWLAMVSWAAAENFTLTDNAALTGDIVKADDGGLMLKLTDDTFTNVAWARVSQATLKVLAGNPKYKPLVEPFMEVDAAARPPKEEIKVNEVKRLKIPESPSFFGGLFGSSLGLFLVFLIYAANLWAAYEISIVKARPAAQVMGASAVLPIIGPVIFLIMPMKLPPQPTAEEEALAAQVATAQKLQMPIEIAEASWKQAEAEEKKKQEPQIFARGKFTFNKRFVETKFADFAGTASGAMAQNFHMELKTAKEQFAVARIAQVGQTEILLDTPNGQVTVLLADIQEVKLTPKAA